MLLLYSLLCNMCYLKNSEFLKFAKEESVFKSAYI